VCTAAQRPLHGGARWRVLDLGLAAVKREGEAQGSRGCHLRRAAGVSWASVPLSTGEMLGGDLGRDR